MGDYNKEHYSQLRFVDKGQEGINKFQKYSITFTGGYYKKGIKSKMANPLFDDDNDHPDQPLINWVVGKLGNYIPKLTMKLWAHEQKADATRRLDFKLLKLYNKEELNETDNNLSDNMEVNKGGLM